MSYRHLLCAVDLAEDAPRIAARAKELAGKFGAKLTLLHVVEYIPVDPAGEALLPPPIEVERDLVAGARKRLEALGAGIGVAGDDLIVVVGNIRGEIVSAAAGRGC